jgi:response regulator of citrate/malate metabolism
MFHTNPEINAQITEAIAMFCKTNKVNKAKTEQFVSSILGMLPKAGKPVSQESIRIRNEIKAMIEELKQFEEGFTAKELAKKLEATPVDTINNLKWLAQNEGIITEFGKLEHQPGQRGRRQMLWRVA